MSQPSQEQWAQIDEALGIGGPHPSVLAVFEEAGFDEDQARRGAAMMKSGRYFGFADVATSLATLDGRTLSAVQETKIAAVARRLEDEAAARKNRPSPWGRPPVQEQRTNAFGRLLPPLVKTPTEADFREVGLNESDAKAAAAGLAEGRYVSFEDACLATALFGGSKSMTLSEGAMRAKAREFARVDGK